MPDVIIARSAEKSQVPEIQLVITSNNVEFSPPVKDGVEIEWSRGGTPGKLTFTTIKVSQNGMNFFEGDKVCFYVNKELFFQGYVFKKQRNKNGKINVTCYDQLRYFKNKFSYVFVNKTATEIIKSLCDDFKLNVGELDDTKSQIPSITEENKEAWDVILKALNETLTSTGKMYNIMDVQGKVTLKDSENMICDTVITSDTAQDFDYTSSIDDETYTEIVLYYKPQTNISGETIATDTLTGDTQTPISSANGIVEKFVQTGLSYVGVLDEAKAGRQNPVSVYGFGGRSDQWCGWYVSFIADKAGIPTTTIPRTGASQGFRQYAQRVGKWHPAAGYTPRRGDIIVFTKNNDSAHGHTGIVTGGTSPYHFTSVEGNSSNRCQTRTYNGSGWSKSQFLNGFFSWYE